MLRDLTNNDHCDTSHQKSIMQEELLFRIEPASKLTSQSLSDEYNDVGFPNHHCHHHLHRLLEAEKKNCSPKRYAEAKVVVYAFKYDKCYWI